MWIVISHSHRVNSYGEVANEVQGEKQTLSTRHASSRAQRFDRFENKLKKVGSDAESRALAFMNSYDLIVMNRISRTGFPSEHTPSDFFIQFT